MLNGRALFRMRLKKVAILHNHHASSYSPLKLCRLYLVNLAQLVLFEEPADPLNLLRRLVELTEAGCSQQRLSDFGETAGGGSHERTTQPWPCHRNTD